MQILIIRHADPDYERDSLTEKGIAEANALAYAYRNFRFDRAYCSPQGRAQATAKTFCDRHGIQPVTLGWLAEMEVPVQVPYEQKPVLPWDFIPAEFVKREKFFCGEDYLSDEWLSGEQLQKRYKEATEGLDLLLKNHGYRREGRLYRAERSNTDVVILFCHFGIGCVIMSHLLNIPFVLLSQYFECQPTGVTTLVTEERQKGIAQFRCLRYSDISHLTLQNVEPSFCGRFCEVFDSDDRH